MTTVEIDWGAAEFEQGTEQSRRIAEREERQRQAMEALQRRIAERDPQPDPREEAAAYARDRRIAERSVPDVSAHETPSYMGDRDAPPDIELDRRVDEVAMRQSMADRLRNFRLWPGEPQPEAPPVAPPVQAAPPALADIVPQVGAHSPQSYAASMPPSGNPLRGGPPMVPEAPPQTPADQSPSVAAPLPPPSSPIADQQAPTTPAEPPPMPVAGEASPDATTNPNAPTVTAGASAQALRQSQPVTPALGGPTGLATASDVTAPMESAESSFGSRNDTTQAEDDRRERLRRILRAVAAIGGMATLGRGGGIGGALPGAIGASLVRDSNNEERLLAEDARTRELGAEDERRRQLMEQMQLRRRALEGTEQNRAETLDLRRQELEASNADRSLRTGIQLREDERESDLLDPGSAVSRREREALIGTLQTQPREVQQAFASRLNGMAAEELRSIRDQLERGGRARTIAGGGTASGAMAAAGTAGSARGAGTAPPWYVAIIAQGNGEVPSNPSEETIRSAQSNWDQMSPRERARLASGGDQQRGAEVLGRSTPGYEQAAGGAISQEQYRQARAAIVAARTADAEFEAAIQAAQEVEDQPLLSELATRAGARVGIDSEAVARFNAARSNIMATLQQLREAGVMGEAEYARNVAELRDLSDARNMIMDSTTRLRAIRESIRRQAQARVESLGYRATGSSSPQGQPGTGADGQPVQGDAPVTGAREPTMVTLTFRRPDGSTRSRQIDARQRDYWIRRAPEGWTVVQ